MLWVFIGLLGGFAFVFLTRLFWADAANRPETTADAKRPLVTLAVIVLIVALIMMIATGRLHWVSALITGMVPFLRRVTSLLRFAPIFSGLFSGLLNNAGRQTPKSEQQPAPGTLTVAQARLMLEVADDASKSDIVAAHRRLIARNHPDRGGSNYIATQLNTAKDLLLRNL